MTAEPFIPTEKHRAIVREMAGYGCSPDDIAATITHGPDDKSITVTALKKQFKRELASGPVLMNAQVAKNLFRIATTQGEKGQTTACIFWLKTRAGWTETSTVEVTNKGGKPLGISAFYGGQMDLFESVTTQSEPNEN